MSTTFHEDLEAIQNELENLNQRSAQLASIGEEQATAILGQTDAIRDQTVAISSAIREQTALLDFRLGEMNWQLSLQTEALFNIDHTLKTPTETLANEWRARAEELRRRGELKQAEHLFLRCLEPENNPLDYRTYIGLAKTYEMLNDPERALEYYEKSLRHAPKTGGRNWRSYSYLLMGLVYKALSEHQEAFESSRKAIRLSPKYPAAHYHHARNSALVGDQASCAFSLSEALRASAQFCVSAMLDNHFDPWRNDIVHLIANETLSPSLPDKQYHRAWFQLSRQCANLNQHENVIRLLQRIALYDPSYFLLSMGEEVFEPIQSDVANSLAQISLKKNLDPARYHKAWYELSEQCATFAQEENCIGLLEKVILHNPTYFDTAVAELTRFGPLQGAVQLFLQRIHADAREKAKQSIAVAESKLPVAREAVAQAKLALQLARDKGQLESETAYGSAQSSLELARKNLTGDRYDDLLRVPLITKEANNLARNALENARKEKQHYEQRTIEKVKRARKEVGTIMIQYFGYALMAAIPGCVCGWILAGRTTDEAGLTGMILAACVALLAGAVKAANKWEEIRGPDPS